LDVIELCSTLIKAKSVTPSDDGLLDFISEILNDFTAIRIDDGDVKNLFLYKKFGDGVHLNFAGHVDVVPAGEGWSGEPFSGEVKNGFLYGRGAQDMKSGVASFVMALKDVNDFNGTLSIMLTSDEEGDATHGTLSILKYLKEKNMLPDFCVVAEPTCEQDFGDAIKIGRRGSINGTLTILGRQGHAAYPEKSINPVNILASRLDKLAGYKLDNGDDAFAPSEIVITDIRGGLEVTNVTPGSVKLMFNVRNSTKTDTKSIEEYINSLFNGIDFSLTLNQSAHPFVTNKDSQIVKNLEISITDVLDRCTKRSTAGGTSDARYIAPYGIEVVEFGVINNTIHAPDEKVGVEELQNLHTIFSELIKKF